MRNQHYLPLKSNLFELFEDQAKQHPNSIAIVCNNLEIDYKCFYQQINNLSNYVSSLNLEKSKPIGILIERNINAIVAIFSLLKLGIPYVPLNPNDTRTQLTEAIRELDIKNIIIDKDLKQISKVKCKFINIRKKLVDNLNADLQRRSISTDDLFYIPCTSGSTGTPKGVAVTHRQIINRLNWMWRIFPVKNNEVFLQRSSLNFAISIWEIFGALLKGAKVLITNNELFSNSQLLIKIFRNRGVTRIVVTPTVLKLLLQTKNFNEISLPKLNHLSICGEIFYCKLYNDLRSRFKKAKIIHQYGTTETHDALFYITDKKRIHTDKVPLKYPVDNLSIYILDDKLKACPIGTPGKLYISGPSLARGYYLNCRLTSQSFLPNPYNPLERMYSTNDIVSKDKHGYIYYIGRSDNQIKFNGIRIELESIEYRIKEFKNIRNAVVLYHEENNAFFLTSFIEVNNNFRLPQLRSYLEKSLPHNIFISDFIITKSLPKNKNGKLDRHGLIKLINTKNSIKEEFRNENSNSSINIWREIFNRKEVKKDDNFFKLGGNSLHALMICNKIASRYKIKIKMEAIFAFPSPWLLAQKFNLPF